jgi:hypothetical protein
VTHRLLAGCSSVSWRPGARRRHAHARWHVALQDLPLSIWVVYKQRPDRLLLPNPAVDTFAQQVSVPAVAGVLLDAVNPHLPQGDAVVAYSHAQVRVPS